MGDFPTFRAVRRSRTLGAALLVALRNRDLDAVVSRSGPQGFVRTRVHLGMTPRRPFESPGESVRGLRR